MEGLGKKLQEARIARNLTLDEAARLTKIRPTHLAEIEAEDFSHFASLAYAKGFLLIYGKFLDVDVTPYLEAFETSSQMTVDGYSYLQDNPEPPPRRTFVERRPRPRRERVRAPASFDSGPRTRVWPFVIGVIAVVVGFGLMKLILDIQRISPHQTARVETAPTPGNIVAPRAVPVQPLPTGAQQQVAVATPTAPPKTASGTEATQTPATMAAASSSPSVAPTEPEIRRAEPVHPEDLVRARNATATSSAGANAKLNSVDIKPLRRTYVRVVVNNDDQNPVIEKWISPTEGTMHFEGERVSIRVLDREAVQIRKNGKTINNGDADVKIE